LAEQRSPKPQVGGSIPSWPAILRQGKYERGKEKSSQFMSEKIETEERNKDWLKWIAVAAMIMAGIYLNSYFSSESLLLRTVGLVVIAGFAGWIASLTIKGRALIDLCLEARVEIRKVVWPSRQETTQTTIVVLIVIFIVAIILWLLDSMLNGIISSFIT
jgi:preprotein translocase subunit SecE